MKTIKELETSVAELEVLEATERPIKVYLKASDLRRELRNSAHDEATDLLDRVIALLVRSSRRHCHLPADTWGPLETLPRELSRHDDGDMKIRSYSFYFREHTTQGSIDRIYWRTEIEKYRSGAWEWRAHRFSTLAEAEAHITQVAHEKMEALKLGNEVHSAPISDLEIEEARRGA